MAPAASDNDATDVGMHPERKQAPPVSSSATVASESNGSESDTDEEVFKLEMKLLWAERKCIDLDRTYQEERKARVAVEAQLRALQSNGSDLTIAVSEAEELRATVQALEITVEQKDAEVLVVQGEAITAVQDADATRVQLRTSQVENRRLENKVATLERALSDANIRSSSSSISQAVINELQIKIGSQQTQIDQNVRDSSRSMANAERLQEKVDSQRQELDDVQERLNVAEAVRDRLRTENAQRQMGNNAHAAGHPRSSDRLENGNLEPDNEVELLKDRLADLRWNALDYVINLDLANRNFRGFDCEHANVRYVPDGRNSSHGPTASKVAEKMFRHWQDDEQFVRGYVNRRQKLIKHHKAHWRVQEGNGVRFWLLREEFNDLDARRGLDVTYT